MKYKNTLIEGVLLKRYKRFFADVEFIHPDLKKKVTMTIHVPNTGSMKGVLAKPAVAQKCWFTLNEDPARKLKGTLEAVQTLDQVWVGVNTSVPNKVVQEAAVESLKSSKSFFKHWKGYKNYRSEFKISKESRLDGVFYNQETDLENAKAKKHFIEIKNTTLMTEVNGQKQAQFPDCVTERGQKHLVGLMKLMKQGHQAELIFAIQRSDAEVFSVAKDLDPKYAQLFNQAIEEGLIVTPVVIDFNPQEIALTQKVLKVIK